MTRDQRKRRDAWRRLAESFAKPQPKDWTRCHGICARVGRVARRWRTPMYDALQVYGVPWHKRVERDPHASRRPGTGYYFAPVTPGAPDEARVLFCCLMASLAEDGVFDY